MAQKIRFSPFLGYLKSNQFPLGSSEICQCVGTVKQLPTGPHPGKSGLDGDNAFWRGEGKVWAGIYKTDKCACSWKWAIFQMLVLMILTVIINQGVAGERNQSK